MDNSQKSEPTNAKMRPLPFLVAFYVARQCLSLSVSRVKGVEQRGKLPVLKVSSKVATSGIQRQKGTYYPRKPQARPAVPKDSSKLLLTTSLLKSIVGGGILAVPAAVASLHAAELSVPLSLGMVAMTAAMYAYTFSLLGRVCESTGATSYIEAWEKTMGPNGAPFVSTILSLKTTMACVVYSMILADSAQIFTHLSRLDSLLLVTVLFLLPLCLLPDLTSLAPFCLVGIVAVFLTAGAMAIRLWDGSYAITSLPTALPEGTEDVLTNEAALALQQLEPITSNSWTPGFDTIGPLMGLACTLAGAFVAHYNAPRVHAELSDSKEFHQITVVAFAVAAALTGFVGVVGFQTFGSDVAPIVLSNYATNDSLMFFCQFLVALSLICTFPLPFVGLRDNLKGQLDTMALDDATLSVLLLSGITAVAAIVHDLGLFLQVAGGSVSTGVAAIMPVLMYRRINPPNSALVLPNTIMWAATAIGVTGVGQALHQACAAH